MTRLAGWLTEGTSAERVEVVNALIAQAQMAGRESPTAEACGEQLFSHLEDGEDSPLSHRIIRALGQIGFCNRRVLARLEKLLKKRHGGEQFHLQRARVVRYTGSGAAGAPPGSPVGDDRR